MNKLLVALLPATFAPTSVAADPLPPAPRPVATAASAPSTSTPIASAAPAAPAVEVATAAPAEVSATTAPPGMAPSPWGASPYVLPYQPPAIVDKSHHGLTLEVGVGGGSTTVDQDAGAFTFAIGGWVSHDVSLAFRATGVGTFTFGGASVQLFTSRSLWLGTGIGAIGEHSVDRDGFSTMRTSGIGGFGRIGYNLANHGPHALYITGELQAGAVESQARAIAFFALGYQML